MINKITELEQKIETLNNSADELEGIITKLNDVFDGSDYDLLAHNHLIRNLTIWMGGESPRDMGITDFIKQFQFDIDEINQNQTKQ